jgi:alkaline phosphatase D
MGRFDRRSFLIAAAAALAVPRLWARPAFAAYPFSLGIASGAPLPDGVVLWTRLAPDPLNGGGLPPMALEVRWEVARDEGFRDIVRHGTALAEPQHGHAVHIEVTGLEPARWYWYRFMAGDAVSAAGRTRTAPAAGASASSGRQAPPCGSPLSCTRRFRP